MHNANGVFHGAVFRKPSVLFSTPGIPQQGNGIVSEKVELSEKVVGVSVLPVDNNIGSGLNSVLSQVPGNGVASKYIDIDLTESEKEYCRFMSQYSPDGSWIKGIWAKYFITGKKRIINPQWKLQNEVEWKSLKAQAEEYLNNEDLVSDVDPIDEAELGIYTEKDLSNLCPECFDKN